MMNKPLQQKLSWIRVGGSCGLAGIALYLAAAFAPLPDMLGYAAAFGFGPLLAVSAIGLYHCLALRRDGPLVQIATLLAIAGGITVLIMLTTQQAIFSLMQKAVVQAGEPSAQEVYKKISTSLNAVHLGLDVAWDVLIAAAVILFGLSMLKHPAFGMIVGGLGILLGSLLLVFNLHYFPTPPASAESIDWGPFVALWFVVVFVMLWRAVKWAKSLTENNTL